MCGPARAASPTPLHASRDHGSSRRPSKRPSPVLALVSRAQTRAWPAAGTKRLRKLKMRDAGSRSTDVETALRWVLSEDIVKFDMGFLGKRIMNTLPSSQSPKYRSLLMASRATPTEWIRSGAELRLSPVWLPVAERRRSGLRDNLRSSWSWIQGRTNICSTTKMLMALQELARPATKGARCATASAAPSKQRS